MLPALCALILLTGSHAADAAFTAAVDRKELYQNEYVVLTLSLTDSDTRLRAEGVSPNVDLTVLTPQFELGVPRTDFRFNIAREERRSTSELTIELFPRRSGRLTIPAFAVDGLSTRPIALQVLPLPADARPEVFARSGIARRELYVGEQTLLYLDLYYRTDLKQAEFGGSLATEPLQIEAHALPNSERSEKIDGLDYNVTRSAWAVAPQSDAAVTLHLPALWIETRAGKRWRLPAQDQHIAVRALPAGTPPGTLAARPQLTQSPFQTAMAGRLAPWRITLQAAVGLNTLPERLPITAATNEFKVYFDPPERRLETRPDGGVDSIAVYQGYLMPFAAGALTAPALDLPYFDAARGTVEHVTLPGQPLQVAAGAPAAEETAPALPAVMPSAPTRPAAEAAAAGSAIVWQIAAAVLSILWLVTLALWRHQTTRRGERRAKAERVSAGHPLQQRLLAALGGARTLEQGLRDWERRNGSDETVRAAVRAVQRLCYRPGDGDAAGDARPVVERAIGAMRGRRPADHAVPDDGWSPQAFRPAGRRTRDASPPS
jgi:hypothetical protein